MDMTPNNIPQELQEVNLRMNLDALAKQLAQERAELELRKEEEAEYLEALQQTDWWIDWQKCKEATKEQETLAKQTYEAIRENLVRLYDITKEKSSHPSGGISLKKKYVISDEDAAVQWCKDHNMPHLFVTKIANAKDFCEIVAKMPDTDFAEIQEIPQASIKTDLSAFLESESQHE